MVARKTSLAEKYKQKPKTTEGLSDPDPVPSDPQQTADPLSYRHLCASTSFPTFRPDKDKSWKEELETSTLVD